MEQKRLEFYRTFKATWRPQIVPAPEIPLRTGSSQTLLADHHILMGWERARAVLVVRWEGTVMPSELSVGIGAKREGQNGTRMLKTRHGSHPSVPNPGTVDGSHNKAKT